jgi:hypothetical protein
MDINNLPITNLNDLYRNTITQQKAGVAPMQPGLSAKEQFIANGGPSSIPNSYPPIGSAPNYNRNAAYTVGQFSSPTSNNGNVLGTKTTTNNQTTNPTTNYTDLINAYKQRGWNNMDAIMGDINAGGYKNWYGQDGQQAPGYDPGVVDAYYQEANGLLDQHYNDLVANKQNYLNQYTQPFDALRPGIENAYQADQNTNQMQRGQNDYQTQNAIDAARRLYQEMTTRGRQMYGGSNSAGDFAQAFYGRENQRQMGNIQNQSGQNLQSLDTAQRNSQGTYEANLKQLESQKAAALTQAQVDFQNRLDSINQMKEQFAGQKAQQKLDLLSQYRTRVQQMQDAADAYARQLQSQAFANIGNLTNSVAYSSSMAGKPVDLQSILAPQYSMLNRQLTPNVSPLSVTGYYDPNKKR